MSARTPTCASSKVWKPPPAGCRVAVAPGQPRAATGVDHPRTRLAPDAEHRRTTKPALPGPARQPQALCRLRAAAEPAQGAELLCYTGGFSVALANMRAAEQAGGQGAVAGVVTSIDSSGPALDQAALCCSMALTWHRPSSWTPM